MSENTQSPTPSAAVRSLDRLVGTWAITGGSEGTVVYEWMEGGHFLLQRVDLESGGQRIRGLEVIGHEHRFGEEPGEDLRSRFYGNDGGTLDYVYELEGDTLTIWGGDKGSPAYFRGRFDDAGTTMVGAWVFPGGGGYDSTMTRV